MKFFTTSQIGPNRHLTREGFLVCMDVPIARTGEMIYGPDDRIPVTLNEQGFIRVLRDAEQVFDPRTIASALGKPIVDEHPTDDVTPKTWRQLACGVVLNPRRGEGDDSDLLLADFMVTDAETMAAINSGKREVSCGYDAEYDELGPGLGRQRDIIINHVALVERGRCGPRCSIGDEAPAEVTIMSKAEPWLDKLRSAFLTRDEKVFLKTLDEAPKEKKDDDDDKAKDAGGALHLHVGGGDEEPGISERMKKLEEAHCQMAEDMKKTRDAIARIADAISGGGKGGGKDRKGKDDEEETEEEKKKREEREAAEKRKTDDESAEASMKSIEGNLEMEAPPGTADKARKARDSEYLGASFQDTVAGAEILAPGIRVPTYDRAAAPTKTFDAICGLRRQALELAYSRPEVRPLIDDVLGAGATLDVKRMTCDGVRTMFRSVVAMAKSANNQTAVRVSDMRAGKVAGPARTLAELNVRNAEKYGTAATK